MNDKAEGRGHGVAPRIEIRAPAEVIWELICDFAGWGRWNPLYVETSGSIAVGNTVQYTVAVRGMKPRKGTATVTIVTPCELLEYRTTALLGLVRATRFIEIHEATPERCTIVNGEIMSGPIGRILARFFGPRVEEGLAAMNEELRKLAEARWQAHTATAGASHHEH